MLVGLLLVGPAAALVLLPWRRTRPLAAPLVLVPLGVAAAVAAVAAVWCVVFLTPAGGAPQPLLLYGGVLPAVALGAVLGLWAARRANRALRAAPWARGTGAR